MAVKIRLSRIGKKNAPFYRIVAVDSRKKRDGAFLEDLGTIDGLASKVIRIEQERIDAWVSLGAIPTDAIKKICKEHKKSTQGSVTPKTAKAPKKTTTEKAEA